MKVAFIGDSFCKSKLPHSWTSMVAARLGARVVCHGRGGVSVGQAYFDLQEHLSDADIYFMFYTDHNRLYNPHVYPLNIASCMDYGQNGLADMVSHEPIYWPDAKIWDAGLGYFQRIYHEPYHILVHELLVQRCDHVLSQHIAAHPHKRALHFHSFPPVNGINPFASGPVARESMMDMLERHGKNMFPGDNDANHMSVELNTAMADAVMHAIDSETQVWVDLP